MEIVHPWVSLIISTIFGVITAGIALWGVHHQIQSEIGSRHEEAEKAKQERQTEWNLLQQSLTNQIQLAKTNRGADFQIWRLELEQQHSNWITERNIEFSNQMAAWHQQHFEEWTQQASTFEAQQKKNNILEKEKLYEDVVYHLYRFQAIANKLSWYSWRLSYLQDLDIPVPHGTTQEVAKEIRAQLASQINNTQINGEKYSADYDQEKVEIYKLMQAVKIKYSDALSDIIDSGLVSIDKFNVGVMSSPGVDLEIQKICKGNTNTWLQAELFYEKNFRNYLKPEQFENAWNKIGMLMRREIGLDNKNIPLKPEYFLSNGPFDLGNGLSMKFEDTAMTNLNIRIETESLHQTNNQP